MIVKEIRNPSAGSKLPFDQGLWNHPMLELYKAELPKEEIKIPSKLYLVPTPEFFGRGLEAESDPEFAPQPTALSELPEVQSWVNRFVLTVLEIWSGKRSSTQLARWCHRQVYQQLNCKSPAVTHLPKIRKIYICEPIEGVAETTVTLKIGERVRSLILRFEGVDNRWLCTEFILL